MIVRAIEVGFQGQFDASNWLSLGAEYVVLSIETHGAETSVLVITDEGGHSFGLFPLARFEIVEGTLSRTWMVSGDVGGLTIGPTAWAREGFWEELDGDTPEARALADIADGARIAIDEFDAAVSAIYDEAGRQWPTYGGLT